MLSVLTDLGDQAGRHELAQGDLDRGWPNGPAAVGECGGKPVKGVRAASSERREHASGGGRSSPVGSASLASAVW